MREVSKKAKSIFYFLMFLPFHLFGAGGQNVLKTLETKANEQITEAGSSAASVINTVITVFGIIWVVVFLTFRQITEESVVHALFSHKILFVSEESLEYFQKKTHLPNAASLSARSIGPICSCQSSSTTSSQFTVLRRTMPVRNGP